MKSSEVRYEKGMPALYVDGKRRLPMLFGLSDIPGSAANTAYAQKNIAQFAAEGIHLVTADTELRLGWHKTTPFEWEPLQEEIAACMQADPDTGVLLRLHVNAPYWWLRDHPEEQVLYNGEPGIDNGETERLIRDDHNHHIRASIASERWMEEAGDCLRQFCENVWNTPEGEAVLGIQVACGVNGEWHQWGTDTSMPMRRRFTRMLREEYGTDEALREAWGDPGVTIDTAPFLPDPGQPGSDGLFRDPVKQRAIMDAQKCIQITTAEAILYFCEIVKKSWGRPVLAGSFYGYYLGTGGPNAPIGGHLMPQMLYARRDVVDFLCGPFPYFPETRSAFGVPMQRALLESNRLRGMLWLTEMDQHPAGTIDYVGGDPNLMDETIAVLRRNVLMPFLAGEGMWFYDHRMVPGVIRGRACKNPYCASIYRKFGWWDNPTLLREIGRLRALLERYTLRQFRPAADVLIVYNPDTHFATAGYVEQEYALQDAVQRCGAAVDCIYLRELSAAQMERYKLVIFPNAYRLTPQQRAMIRERTAGKQTVFLYAAGYSDDHTLDEAHMRALTGLAIRRRDRAEGLLRSLLTGEEARMPEGKEVLSPGFTVEDPEAEVLARYENGEAAAARKGDAWYFALPLVTHDLMRRIVAVAGVHVYCEAGDPVLAGCGLVALNCPSGGERTVTLKNGKQVRAALPPMTTWILDAETGETL